MPVMRLDKYMSDLGIATRKELRQIIRSGRVTVDGTAVTMPEHRVDPEKETVALDGTPLAYARFRYFMLDKPRGVVTATEDGKQKTVLDLLPPELRRLGLFPVGRLDKDTSGLLLLTNDGDFAHRVISPKSGILKVYLACTDGDPDETDARRFRDGIELKDGTRCLPAKLEPLGGCRCLVTVQEGKYHQVKRMLAACGKPVTELRRLKIGELTLDENMKSGEWRELTQTDLCKVINDGFIAK